MKTHVRTSLRTRISLMVVTLLGLLMACQSLAQDAGSAPAVSPAGNVEPENPAAPAAVAEPVVSGIPTDPLGIADAMGRPFTAAFIIASVIGVWSVIERLVVLRRRRVIPRGFVDRGSRHLCDRPRRHRSDGTGRGGRDAEHRPRRHQAGARGEGGGARRGRDPRRLRRVEAPA